MSGIARRIASLRVTLAGLVLLLLLTLATYRFGTPALWWLCLPLGLLAVNLVFAVATNPVFRTQRSLLAFHLGLLAVMLLIGAGLLAHFQGRVELVEGQAFDASAVNTVSRGPLAGNRLDQVTFEQGPVRVKYSAALVRTTTASTIYRQDAAGNPYPVAVDALAGLVVDGYRIKPTFNKGFSLLLEWRGDDGSRQVGAVNFPSYPEFEWKQQNRWTAPDGAVVDIELLLAERVPDSAWTLTSADREYRVRFSLPQGQRELGVGDAVRIPGGSISVAGLRLWIGYRIDANPFLPWIFTAALLSIVSLAWHVASRLRSERTAVSRLGAGVESPA